MIDNNFYQYLKNLANTDGDEYGPSRIFNGLDGMEYFFCASDGVSGNLDLKYIKYYPSGGSNPPTASTIKDVTVLNSASNEAYLTFDWNFDKAYYSTDRGGDYDIYENEVESNILRLTSYLEPVMILVMGSIVGFIVLSICLPIFEMNQLIR